MSESWGFTGTREIPTTAQADWLATMLAQHRPALVRHGACTGADELLHKLALQVLGKNVLIKVHPPVDGRRMMTPDWNHPNVVVLAHKPYHKRNRDIVNRSDRLIAMPNGPWRPLGGTWYTVDFARGRKDRYALKRIVPVTICYPDGIVEDVAA